MDAHLCSGAFAAGFFYKRGAPMAQVMDLLAQKATGVCVVSPSATVLEATQLMNRHRIGSLVVTMGGARAEECDKVVGMFTERDVLTRVVVLQRDPAATRVEEVMTADVAFCRPDMDLDEVASMMQKRRIRHLPVCDEAGGLVGMVSIGDLNAWRAEGLDATIHYLNEYIHGRA
jgi:CBS domain-containing protein